MTFVLEYLRTYAGNIFHGTTVVPYNNVLYNNCLLLYDNRSKYNFKISDRKISKIIGKKNRTSEIMSKTKEDKNHVSTYTNSEDSTGNAVV